MYGCLKNGNKPETSEHSKMMKSISPRIKRKNRKPLRQAVHEGFISLKLSDKSIILCFYAFGRLRKYAGSFRFLRRF
jgi:hypothetical protein